MERDPWYRADGRGGRAPGGPLGHGDRGDTRPPRTPRTLGAGMLGLAAAWIIGGTAGSWLPLP